MLKPADPVAGTGQVGSEERSFSALVQQLAEDGKAYAKAELDLARAIAVAKGKALVVPAILLGAAFLLLQAGVTALAVATFLALLPVVGPFFAGLLAFLIFAALAGGLAWLAVKKLRSDL
ncbi:MAG TPA: phage holin family protein [Sphingomicrobium sp.]|nr:phage holin family protein [Sphingomicrobium sp.]